MRVYQWLVPIVLLAVAVVALTEETSEVIPASEWTFPQAENIERFKLRRNTITLFSPLGVPEIRCLELHGEIECWKQ